MSISISIKKISLFILWVGFMLPRLYAQDLEKLYGDISKKDSIRFSGGLSANTTLYKAWGTDNRRDPFFWTINANLSLSYKLLTIPFSVQVTKQQRNFTNPIQAPDQVVGLSPSFKGYTIHLGHRSMQFTQYTLAGAQFFGAGFELNKEKVPWKIKLVYGRFAEAFKGSADGFVTQDLILYDRFGAGVQLRYAQKETDIGVSIFKAKDNTNSLDTAIATALNASPQENFVISTTVKKKITKWFSVDGEYALSAFTRDTRVDEIALDRYSYLNNLNLFTPRGSSSYNSAFNVQANFDFSIFTFNTKYKRIAPDYQTMGAVFLTNNLREISGGVSWSMFKDKVNLSTNVGHQRDNLNESQESQTNRLTSSASINYAINKKWNTALSYSNFSATTRQVFSQFDHEKDQDSLFFLQVTSNANFTLNYATGEKVSKTSSLTLSVQDANDSEGNESKFYNGNFGQQVNFSKTGTQLSLMLNFSSNQNVGVPTQLQLGPIFTVSQSFFKKKVRTSLSNTFQQSSQDGNKESVYFNHRFNVSYTLKKHQFSANTAFLRRQSFTSGSAPFSEIRSGINYNYSF